MSIKVFYNEIDPRCCAWLSNLMDAGHIRPGVISDKSIEDLTPNDVRSYDLVHFFAGIAGWDHALTLAGWRFDGRVTWTGSCPCQPFSAAGKGAGFDDERHLWPAWHWLISQCRPGVIFGEQVASKDGLAWLDLVLTDLEVEGYAAGAFDICAAGVGAPHIRQRLWIVADRDAPGRGEQRRAELLDGQRPAQRDDADGRGAVGGHSHGLADSGREGRGQVGALVAGGGSRSGTQGLVERPEHGGPRDLGGAERPRLALGVGVGRIPSGSGRDDARQAAVGAGVHADGALAHPGRAGSPEQRGGRVEPARPAASSVGHWSTVEWVQCRDGKARPIEPGVFPLAHGVPGRVGLLRGAGNAIVPACAQAVIEAYLSLDR